jgi:tRNA(Phe) wybutosine-synthesizing methylase Tyw3
MSEVAEATASNGQVAPIHIPDVSGDVVVLQATIGRLMIQKEQAQSIAREAVSRLERAASEIRALQARVEELEKTQNRAARRKKA